MGLKFGNVNILSEDQNDEMDEKLIVFKLPQLLKGFGYDPDKLIEATKIGDTVSLRQFRNFIREKVARLISAACFADFIYFADSLLEVALVQYDLSNTCVQNSTADCTCAKKVDEAIKENSWTLDVLDSLGKFPSGILTGNFWMLGDFEECVEISVEKSSPKHKWEGQYCRVDISLYGNKWYENITDAVETKNAKDECSSVYSFKLGTCFPSTCSSTDVQAIVDYALNIPQKLSGKKVICGTTIYCHNDLELKSDTSALILIFFLMFMTMLVIFGSVYDYFVFQSLLTKLPSVINIVLRKDSEKIPKQPDHSVHLETHAQFYAKQSWFIKLMLAFSVYTNGKKVFETKQKPGQLHCINGIRVLSVIWVVLGHTYYTTWNYLDNPLGIVTEIVQPFYNHMLINSTVSTDTFYLLSSTLISYLWLREMRKSNGKRVLSGKLWIMYYVHRYVRLTPVYMVIMAIHAILIRYVADGPMWNQNGQDAHGCVNSWWTNLFYVNNFFWLKEQCMTWTWYLANDFQFYVFAPPILILLWKKGTLALILIGLLILSTSMLRMALILAHEKWPPIAIVLNDLSLASIIDGFWTTIYMKPYCRCGPFLVGLVLGYILYKTNLKVNIPKVLRSLGWMASTTLALGILFGLYDYSLTTNISLPGKIIYAAFGRTFWAIAIAWVIFACSTGHGGFVNSFLSAPFWIPLSRLVYCTYLIHPILINLFFASQMRPIHYSGHFLYVTYFLTNVLFSFSLALVFTLMFEVPIMGLEKIIFRLNFEEKKAENNINEKINNVKS